MRSPHAQWNPAEEVMDALSKPKPRLTCEHGTVGYCEPCALVDPGELGEQKPKIARTDRRSA